MRNRQVKCLSILADFCTNSWCIHWILIHDQVWFFWFITYASNYSLNPFLPIVTFYMPWKQQKTLRVPDFFRGYRDDGKKWVDCFIFYGPLEDELCHYFFIKLINIKIILMKILCSALMFVCADWQINWYHVHN